jgi:hypothetical protein
LTSGRNLYRLAKSAIQREFLGMLWTKCFRAKKIVAMTGNCGALTAS